MSVEYVIIQAGGKGTRLKNLTRNKPKAIVSVNNLPIIYHLFRKYPEKKYIIIGDYLKEVLDRYLETFPEVEYLTVGTDGNVGTCSGISNALALIPFNKRIMLIWSDLILGKDVQLPCDEGKDYIGISGTFPCRWSYRHGEFIEEESVEFGVAGMFIFTDKTKIISVPNSGEFVKWLQTKKMKFSPYILGNTAEYGLLEKINKKQSGKCRPFNSMEKIEGKLIKRGIDDQGRKLAIREKNWYAHVSKLDIPIPKIYSFDPLTIELINGKNVFEYDLPLDDKKRILCKIIEGLNHIHSHEKTFPDKYSIIKAYYTKTFERLDRVRNLIPFANDRIIYVNGKACKNVYYYREEVRNLINNIPCNEFCLIHGDCTFSNIMLNDDKNPIFIDPRGYFGNCELIGDPNYDWAKLYYSLIGNYDQFNLGNFSLTITDTEVLLDIESNGWECLKQTFTNLLPGETDIKVIELLHALIWLSLTTYAWDDYDSICGAFYNGIQYLEGIL